MTRLPPDDYFLRQFVERGAVSLILWILIGLGYGLWKLAGWLWG